MLNHPTSSPMMKRMLGFLSCAIAAAATDVAQSTMIHCSSCFRFITWFFPFCYLLVCFSCYRCFKFDIGCGGHFHVNKKVIAKAFIVDHQSFITLSAAPGEGS